MWQLLTEHEKAGLAFAPTLPPSEGASGLGSILPCLTSLGQLLEDSLPRPSPQPALDSRTEEETAREGSSWALPLQAHPPPRTSVYMSTPCLHIDTICLHQALSTQQKVKAEVSCLPSSEAASADPEPQREAFLSTQIIFFFFFPFAFYCC